MKLRLTSQDKMSMTGYSSQLQQPLFYVQILSPCDPDEWKKRQVKMVCCPEWYC